MSDIIHHWDIYQGTDEWKALKSGKFGGTSAELFLTNGRNENGIGKGLQTAVYKKVAEFVCGPDQDDFTSAAMDRGNNLEPLARDRYESETFQTVTQVGYIQSGEFLGVSPDGLVASDGAIEIKSPQPKTYIEWLDTREIPKWYYAQIQWLMFLTGRKWCDYVVYCPEFAPMDITITRVEPDEAAFEAFRQKTAWVETEMTRLLEMVAQKESA